LAEQYDTDNLALCPDCLISDPQPAPDGRYPSRCPNCDGVLRDWSDRNGITTLTQRIDAVRDRLDAIRSRLV
jgi:hypothetical protein